MNDMTVATADEDGYVRYFTEKLWAWIPEVYRTADLSSGTLRALIETLAFEAAHQRRSIDRLWDDTIIDYADDWAVPYIGALLGTRMLSPLNPRGRRLDVAKTVAYRRRGGTPWVLEALIHDITGWHGALVEGYTRMARGHHNYDVVTDCPAPMYAAKGDVFATKRAGTANLRSARAGERVDGPFDSYFHMADLRKGVARAGGEWASSRGLYGLQKLNLHLYRVKPYRLIDVSLYRLNHSQYTLDPSGRDVALFAEGKRPFVETEIHEDGTVDGWSPPQAWQMPAPIACRLLNEARFTPSVSDVGAQTDFASMVGQYYASLGHFRADYERLATGPIDPVAFAELVDAAMTADSPRSNLFGETASLYVGVGNLKLTPAQVVGADLSEWSTAPYAPVTPKETAVAVDPARGRVMLRQGAAGNIHVYGRRLHYGLFGDLGAGSYPRRSPLLDPRNAAAIVPLPQASVNAERVVLADTTAIGVALAAGAPVVWGLRDSLTTRWRLAGNVVTVPGLTLVAKDECRPYLRIEPLSGQIVTFKAAVPAAGQPLPDLVLDGVWLGLRPRVGATTVNMAGEGVPTTAKTWTLRLRGDYGRVVLRNVTLDPGGELARIDPGTARHCPAVRLVVEGYVSELVIEGSIVGPVIENVDAAVSPFDPSSVGTISITDSLVIGDGVGPAVSAQTGTVVLKRSTVFGDVRVNRLYASEVLIDGQVAVNDTRDGCFRFSAAAVVNGPVPPVPPNTVPAVGNRLPGQFRSWLFEGGLPADCFVSRRFGDYGLAQLGEGAPEVLRRGAECGSEIGVFCRVMAPVLFDDLRAKLDEYKPIETIAQFVFET